MGESNMTPRAVKKLAVIDGKSVFYRGYYAMPNLSLSDGTPTGGVFGFAVMALEVIKRLQPDYVAVAWDKPKTSIRGRLKLYPAYKTDRRPPPPDFYEQIPLLRELLDAFGWPLYELDDYEADDIMGTLATQATRQGLETLLVTSDLDMLQLVDERVKVFALKKGLSNIELFSPASFTAKYGLTPDQFLDFKALKGDSSDNIPGVPGIGEKGAAELLRQFKTLDGIYENLVLIKESTRRKLAAGRQQAYLSKKLAAIWTDAPLKLDLPALDINHCDPARVRDVLLKLEFRTLVRQLPSAMRVIEKDDAPGAEHLLVPGAVTPVSSDAALKRLAKTRPSRVFIHSRCAGKHGRDPLLLIISFDGRTTHVIDLTKISPGVAKAALTTLLGAAPLIGYDLKATIEAGYSLGLELDRVGHDVLVGAFLINSLRREQSLTELARADLDYEGRDLENLSTEELSEHANSVIHVIAALYQQQVKQLEQLPKVKKLAQRVEWPVIPVLAAMEYEGIQLDTDYLAKMNDELDDQISDLRQQIYGHADQEFNIASPTQLAEILFKKLNLPAQGIKRGKTGYSTAASELDKLRGLHPVIDLITRYREVTKLKNTYVDALPKQVDERSRLHTTFALTVAQTGRLSSSDPNLQNIPTRTDLGRRIRAAFVAGEGKRLVSADYSQFELRLAAYLSGDAALMEQFNGGADVHVMTAAEIYGRAPEDVTKQMRRDAKVVNFGVMYGLGPHGLASATGMSYDAAKKFIDKFFKVRPKLLEFIESVKEQARTKGYVENIFGRRRPTPDVHSANFAVREAAIRSAVNMPFQSSAADIMKKAMVKVQEALDGLNQKDSRLDAARILLQIHDSLIVECPAAGAERVAGLLKTTMEGIVDLPVKLTVDTAIGQNWGEL